MRTSGRRFWPKLEAWRPRHALATATLAVAAGLGAVVKVHDADIWAYVRVGQWIWQHKALPTEDPFSFSGESVYGSHPVLAELIFYWMHAAAGAHGLVILNVILVALLAALVLRLATPLRLGVEPRRDLGHPMSAATTGGFVAAALTTALWLLAVRFRLGPKPELYTYLGFVVVLLVLRGLEQTDSPKGLVWLPVLFFVWGNLHRGALSAAGVLVAVSLFLLVKRRLSPLAIRLAAATAASLLALCLNPAGVDYFSSALRVMATPTYARHIAEWGPLTPALLASHGLWFSALALLWVVSLGVRRRFEVGEVVVALTTLAAARSLRPLPLAAIAMLPGVSEVMNRAYRRLEARAGGRVRESVMVLLALLLGVSSVGIDYVRRWPTSAWGSGVLDWRLPVAGAEFLKRHPPPATRMWNNQNVGGYLLYALGPDVKVLIDGRNDMVYSSALFEEVARTATEPAVLRAQLVRFDIDLAVVQTVGLVETRYLGLLAARDFAPVYMDDLVTVLLRRSAATSAYLDEFGYDSLRPHTAVRRASTFTLERDGATFVQEVERNVTEAPESIRAWYVFALTARGLGRDADYQTARDEVLRLARLRNVDVTPP